MTLDPQIRAVLDGIASLEDDPVTAPDELEAVRLAREGYDQQSDEILGPAEQVGAIDDVRVSGPGGPLALRVYTPAAPGAGTAAQAGSASTSARAQDSLRAAVLYLHGGGWMLGSLESHDRLCRALCNRSAAIVVAVGYRLAPEHPFPSALEDAWAALEWLAEKASALGADPSRLALAGDSAGGALAATLCCRARDRGGPALRLQALLYPATDAAMDTDSYRELGEGYGLTSEAMERCWRLYLGSHASSEPEASPLRVPDLSRLPGALVLTCEYDPLRDEGERYAERLRRAGNEVSMLRCPGMAHGFLRWLGAVDGAHHALGRVCAALRGALEVDELGPGTSA